MYGIVKCLPVSRRKSISDSSPSQSRLLTISAPRLPAGSRGSAPAGPRSAADVVPRASRRSSRLRSVDRPEGSPIIPVPPPTSATGRPPMPLEAEQPEDRDEVTDVERMRRRIEPVVAGDRAARRQPVGQPGRRGVEDAPPLELVQQPVRASTGRARHTARRQSSATPGRRLTFRSRPLCYRAGSDADHSRAAAAPSTRAAAPPEEEMRRVDRRRDPPRRPRVFVLPPGLIAGAGALVAVGAYNYYAQGLPEPEEALENIEFEQQTVVFDRRARSSWRASATLKRESYVTRSADEMLDATTASRTRLLANPGFDPIGIVSAGLDTVAGKSTRRLDDHPAARPRPAPAGGGVRGHYLRAQVQRDHPVDPADPGVPR